jgi:hypothetical protein
MVNRVGVINRTPWPKGYVPAKDEFMAIHLDRLRAVKAPRKVSAACPCGWRSKPALQAAAAADLYDHCLSHDFR